MRILTRSRLIFILMKETVEPSLTPDNSYPITWDNKLISKTTHKLPLHFEHALVIEKNLVLWLFDVA